MRTHAILGLTIGLLALGIDAASIKHASGSHSTRQVNGEVIHKITDGLDRVVTPPGKPKLVLGQMAPKRKSRKSKSQHTSLYKQASSSYGTSTSTASAADPRITDTPANLRAATAPKGTINSLGMGQDPSPIALKNPNGTVSYFFPDSDFKNTALMRMSADLNKANRAPPQAIHTYGMIGTEAPDVAVWQGSQLIYTVSSTKDDKLRALTSDTDDPLGTWTSHGVITYRGQPAEGFDSHVFTHPNGKRYLLYSDHAAILIAEMSSPNTLAKKPKPIVSYVGQGGGPLSIFNCEAPATVLLPNKNGSTTVNLAFSTGDFRAADYQTRLMYQDGSLDPTVSHHWLIADEPILRTDPLVSVYGPGSGGFFDCPSATGDANTLDAKCFAYGAFSQSSGEGNALFPTGNRRTIRVQHVDHDEQGVIEPMHVIATPVII
ncbi:hypothetical protein CBOM_00084 [Ceraceosorus bombacis]|uniref:Uncharacterized protein n=1 Tax=Ceraceosorus bombacis TaxID=401625 RepID=A0A0N7L8V9_9BASI|nr:hypothetical protein CBOM_00084 [Ceraceosorus bombacis]